MTPNYRESDLEWGDDVTDEDIDKSIALLKSEDCDQTYEKDHCPECWKRVGQSGDVPIYGCVNAACRNCHAYPASETTH